jgi:hypothetical protein
MTRAIRLRDLSWFTPQDECESDDVDAPEYSQQMIKSIRWTDRHYEFITEPVWWTRKRYARYLRSQEDWRSTPPPPAPPEPDPPPPPPPDPEVTFPKLEEPWRPSNNEVRDWTADYTDGRKVFKYKIPQATQVEAMELIKRTYNAISSKHNAVLAVNLRKRGSRTAMPVVTLQPHHAIIR